jgi:integrase
LPGVPRESAGADKRAALELLARRRREIQRGMKPRQPRPKTLDELAKRWFESEDPEAMPSLKRNYHQFALHLSPTLGWRDPDSVQPPEALEALLGPYKAGKLKAASIHNLRGTLSAIYAFGRFQGLVDNQPCELIPRGKLPSKRRQKRPTYTDVEAFRLMRDPAVPEDWRVFYSLAGLCGMRAGEVAGLRWEDWDRTAPLLSSLFVHCQYDDRPLKTARGDDGKERTVPVHPRLKAILGAWWLGGFAERYGRAPKPEDRVVPDARTMGALTPGIVSKRAPVDCAALGIANKGMHGLRRFFVTYARAGGAPKEHVERITHNARGDIVDVYTSAEVWPALCRAVQCLSVQWPEWTLKGHQQQ